MLRAGPSALILLIAVALGALCYWPRRSTSPLRLSITQGPHLAAAVRTRLPQWAGHIFTGHGSRPSVSSTGHRPVWSTQRPAAPAPRFWDGQSDETRPEPFLGSLWLAGAIAAAGLAAAMLQVQPHNRCRIAMWATSGEKLRLSALPDETVSDNGGTVPAKDVFEHLFGFEEDVRDLRCVYENIRVTNDAGDGGIIMHSQANGRSYACGTFAAKREDDFASDVARGPGTFSLVLGNGACSKDVRGIDVGALQADPSNCGATFQVASNFNCLEFVSDHDSARNGVSKYIYDKTQGPAASISCMPALVYRNYFLRHEIYFAQYKGQLQRQLNLLCDLPLEVVNGYLQVSFPIASNQGYAMSATGAAE